MHRALRMPGVRMRSSGVTIAFWSRHSRETPLTRIHALPRHSYIHAQHGNPSVLPSSDGSPRARGRRVPAWIALVLCAVAPAAIADGPGSYRPRERPAGSAVSLTDEMQAIETYNAGYSLIQRAEHHEGLAAAASNETDRAAALRDADEAYRASLRKFSDAVALDPTMHEAFTYLGYANRKLGRHEQALRAYGEALRINPDYPHAIEYQGQAYLGLNRIDEAKFNYLRLYALNQAQAHKLLRAMLTWADANAAAAPANVDVAVLKAWIADREKSHDPNESSSGW
jgi:tetratricopeptide (TPR) repeat protein